MDQREKDLMEEVKAIIAEGAEANQSVIKEQPSVEPKAEPKEATPDTKADDNKTQENNETKGDKEVASLQEQLLNGKSIADLEETAAGGGSAAGGNSGDGVSLGAANFAQGGHYSNITDDFRGLDSLVAKGTEEVSSIAGGADLASKIAADGSELKESTHRDFTIDSVNNTLTLNVSTDQVADLTGEATYLPTGTNVDTNLKFSGKAEANADIYLKILADDTTYDYYPDHAVPKGDIAGILKTTADANGDWSISAEKPNWSYTYKAEVTSVDEAGNTHDYAPTTFYIPMESISVAPTDHL